MFFMKNNQLQVHVKIIRVQCTYRAITNTLYVIVNTYSTP